MAWCTRVAAREWIRKGKREEKKEKKTKKIKNRGVMDTTSIFCIRDNLFYQTVHQNHFNSTSIVGFFEPKLTRVALPVKMSCTKQASSIPS